MHLALIHPPVLPPPFAPSTNRRAIASQPPTSCSFFQGQRVQEDRHHAHAEVLPEEFQTDQSLQPFL